MNNKSGPNFLLLITHYPLPIILMFIDQATITVKAGDGGPGCVGFHREKFVPKGGPDGGDGGKGGSILFRVDANIHTLMDFRYKRAYVAKNGAPGAGNKKSGKSADDITILIPPGTTIINAETDTIMIDLVDPGATFAIAKGGDGGRGNAQFATPTNRTPRKAEDGWPGEEFGLRLELKLIADVGLIGLPNAGKSTLLSRLSSARPKIAAYPFTTLEPMLGVAYLAAHQSFVIADIPGLIEGASDGKGLGHEFLRHVERTKILLHLIDVSSEDPIGDFETIRNEVETFNPELAKKPTYFVWTKSDLMPPDEKLPDLDTDLKPISAVTGEGLEELKWFLFEQLAKLKKAAYDL